MVVSCASTRHAQTDDARRFPALVRRVTVNHDRGALRRRRAIPAGAQLDAASNALRFEFAAPGYIDESATEYQSRLDGLETDWSAWTPRGPARLHQPRASATTASASARAASPGAVSEEAVYAFTILPPWYRTWLAYGGYIALLVGARLRRRTALQRRRVVGKERERAQLRRSEAARRSRRGAGALGERGQEERRAAQRDRPRDHRRRSTSTRSSASSTSA